MRKRYSRSYTVLSFLTMFSYRELPLRAFFFAYSQMCIQTSQAPQMTLRRLPHFSQVPTR